MRQLRPSTARTTPPAVTTTATAATTPATSDVVAAPDGTPDAAPQEGTVAADTPDAAAPAGTPTKPHSILEDIIALSIGAFLLSWGLALLTTVDGVTGGVAGAAALVSYLGAWPVAIVFFAINAPFYVLGVLRMGWLFTLKTLAVVTLTSALVPVHQNLIDLRIENPFYACIFAGIVVGLAIVFLFRHQASPGGLGILIYFLQERFGWRGGYIQMAIDVLIVAASAWVLPPRVLLASIVGVVALNLVIALNHRPGRYLARSGTGALRG